MPENISPEFTVLDHVDNIKVQGDVFTSPANEYWALLCLRDGLHFLYRQADQLDKVARKRMNPEGKLRIHCSGSDPSLDGLPRTLLTSAFQWYAVSACQYVRTVGMIAKKLGDDRWTPYQYVDRVIPEVLVFRDKVAAHYSWTMDDSRDTKADQMMSIMPQLAFCDDAFYVGSLQLTLISKGKTTDSSAIKPWSICKVHIELCKRYWPKFFNHSDESTNGEEETVID